VVIHSLLVAVKEKNKSGESLTFFLFCGIISYKVKKGAITMDRKEMSIGTKVLIETRVFPESSFDYEDNYELGNSRWLPVMPATIVAVGKEGVLVDFGQGFKGHTGFLGAAFYLPDAQLLQPEDVGFDMFWPNGKPENTSATSYWFVDEREFWAIMPQMGE
jgi:hypothetical protein